MLNHFNISYPVRDAYLGAKKGFTTAKKRENGRAIHSHAYYSSLMKLLSSTVA